MGWLVNTNSEQKKKVRKKILNFFKSLELLVLKHETI